MSTLHYRIEPASSPTGSSEGIDALVDTGATYSLAPASVLQRLGVSAIDRQTFVLADGRRTERDVGVGFVRVDGCVRPSVVVCGDEEAATLLGAVTLEELGMGICPLG